MRFLMIDIKNVMVATDFSEPSDCALAYGRELARTFDATLHIVHVVESLAARAVADAYPFVLPEMQKDMEESASRQLEALITEADRKDLGAKSVVFTAA